MTTAIVVLAVVAVLVWLSIARPGDRPSPNPTDRDRERLQSELRGLTDYHHDVRL